MQKFIYNLLLSILLIGSSGAFAATPVETEPAAWTTELSDDFSGATVDLNKWSVNHFWGDGNRPDELAYYKGGENRKIIGGTLHIKAVKEVYSPWAGLNFNYTTSQISSYPETSYPNRPLLQPPTEGHPVFFEIAMMPARSKGLVSFAYMLPADGSWPKEIDFVEILGDQADWYHGTVHWGSPGQTQVRQKSNVYLPSNFHRYGALWEVDKVTFYLDGEPIGAVQHDVPNVPMRLLVGVSVGSAWAGAPLAEFTSDTMQVDWLRVYRKN